MSGDDLTDNEIRAMQRKLLGYEAPPKTTVEVKRRRLPKAVAKPKPFIEVQPRRSDLGGDWLYDFYIVSDRGRHRVWNGLDEVEARAEIKVYQRDGSEVRVNK